MNVHASFVAGQPADDARQILLGTLAITALAFQHRQLVCFQPVAGIELVGDGDRHQADPLEQLTERRGVLAPGQGKHLQERRVRPVVAVLGSTLPLRNPDGVTRTQHVLYVV